MKKEMEYKQLKKEQRNLKDLKTYYSDRASKADEFLSQLRSPISLTHHKKMNLMEKEKPYPYTY